MARLAASHHPECRAWHPAGSQVRRLRQPSPRHGTALLPGAARRKEDSDEGTQDFVRSARSGGSSSVVR